MLCSSLVGLLPIPRTVLAITVKLAWDQPSETTNLAGYKIWCRLLGGSYSKKPLREIADPLQTSCQISGLQPEQAYGFVVHSFDHQGNLSAPSNEIFWGKAKISGFLDTDGDGLSDSDEQSIYKTDPQVADTDGDGFSDGQEVEFWGADWSQDIDGDGLGNLLDSDADGDGVCDITELVLGKDPADAADHSLELPSMVFGEIEVDEQWSFIQLKRSFLNPVLIMSPFRSNGQKFSALRIRNMTGNAFEISLNIQASQGQALQAEDFVFIIMEAGSYLLKDEVHIEARSVDLKKSSQLCQDISFTSHFTSTPVVLSMASVFRGQQPLTSNVQSLNREGFECCISDKDAALLTDSEGRLDYIAWEPSIGQANGIHYFIALIQASLTRQDPPSARALVVFNEEHEEPKSLEGAYSLFFSKIIRLDMETDKSASFLAYPYPCTPIMEVR